MTTIDDNYLGRKRILAQRIIGHMPYHKTYVEGFAGSGEIMARKPRAQHTIAIEKDAAAAGRFAYAADKTVIGCAIEYLAQMSILDTAGTFIYLDPPYHPDTRTSSHGYNCELSIKEHEWLLRVITALGCDVMISGYSCPLYERELASWRRVEYPVMTRGGMRKEVLWMNYAEPQPFHHTQAGDNKQQRQDIKRKAQRWAAKYRAMSAAQRLAVMAALAAVDAEGQAGAPASESKAGKAACV